MTRGRLKSNRIDAIRRKIPEIAAVAVPEAADLLRDALAQSLDDGNNAIQSDRHALAKSLYVKATGRDDYGEALSAARQAFSANPSRYAKNYGPSPASENAKEHFEAIVAAMEPLRDVGNHVYAAAVTTMLAYGNVWEFERGWMEPFARAWARRNMPDFLAERIKAALT